MKKLAAYWTHFPMRFMSWYWFTNASSTRSFKATWTVPGSIYGSMMRIRRNLLQNMPTFIIWRSTVARLYFQKQPLLADNF